MSGSVPAVDADYPGTSVERLQTCVARAKTLGTEALSCEWESVRRSILWAGGLKDLPNAQPGQGYTGHSFNDANHCDLTTMLGDVAANENDGAVKGIAIGNRLHDGIIIASLPECGPGGSWSTCMQGCNTEPPRDVAHLQFRSRIAFKLVWCPPTFESFVLVDDAGTLLSAGTPKAGGGGGGGGGGSLPSMRERQINFRMVQGSKYAVAAEKYGEAPQP